MELHDLIRGMKYPKAVATLEGRGITQYSCMMIRQAEEITLIDPDGSGASHKQFSGMRLAHRPDPLWPDQHHEGIKTLMRKNIVFEQFGYYFLTDKGQHLQAHLHTCYTASTGKSARLTISEFNRQVYDFKDKLAEKYSINVAELNEIEGAVRGIQESKQPNLCLNPNRIHSIGISGYHKSIIDNLTKQGLISNGHTWEKGSPRWWLTEKGLKLFYELRNFYPTANEVKASLPAVFQHHQDINLGRDGLMITASKIWWIIANREAIRQQRLEAQLNDYAANQEAIEKNLVLIQTSEQRVARQLEAEGPPAVSNNFWTVEQQREMNDHYWMSEGKAFFLNPNGPLAEALPAPEWWTKPENYMPASMRHLRQLQADDVVAQSLLAPPTKKAEIVPLENKEQENDDIESLRDMFLAEDRYERKMNKMKERYLEDAYEPTAQSNILCLRGETWQDVFDQVNHFCQEIVYSDFSLNEDIYQVIGGQDEIELIMLINNEWKVKVYGLCDYESFEDLIQDICNQLKIAGPKSGYNKENNLGQFIVRTEDEMHRFETQTEAQLFLLNLNNKIRKKAIADEKARAEAMKAEKVKADSKAVLRKYMADREQAEQEQRKMEYSRMRGRKY